MCFICSSTASPRRTQPLNLCVCAQGVFFQSACRRFSVDPRVYGSWWNGARLSYEAVPSCGGTLDDEMQPGVIEVSAFHPRVLPPPFRAS